jgi:hypothetical protein
MDDKPGAVEVPRMLWNGSGNPNTEDRNMTPTDPLNLPQILADLETVKAAGCPHSVVPDTSKAMARAIGFRDWGTARLYYRRARADLQATITEIMGWFCRERQVYIKVEVFHDGSFGFVMESTTEHVIAESGEEAFATPLPAHAAILRAIAETLGASPIAEAVKGDSK